MRKRFVTNATTSKEPIYSYVEDDWVKCSKCHTKYFKAKRREGSVVEIKCKCGHLENVKI